jgi:hypothetical protein
LANSNAREKWIGARAISCGDEVMAKFDDLLAGVASLSLINEPPQPVEPEKSYSAREIARRRWRMENEQEKGK